MLGVDEPGGAGGGDHLARVITQPGRVWVLAVITARTPPGRSTRSHAAYSTPPPGPPRPVMARAAWPASGRPASSSRAGPPPGPAPAGAAPGRGPSPGAPQPRGRRPGRRTARGPGGRLRQPRSASAPVPAAGITTSSPGRENAVMTCAASRPGPGAGPGRRVARR